MNGAALVAIRSLAFRWRRGDEPWLEIDRLDLAPGERVLLHGPSGSGKSTLLGLLGGVRVPQSGSIHVLGRDLVRMTASERDRFRVDHVGFVFQQFNLVPYLTAMQNVLLPCRFSQRRARQTAQATPGVPAAAKTGAGEGMETGAAALLEALGVAPSLWRRPVTGLSVGQQQRVAAARALIGRPELILADEPTSALDDDARQLFLDLLLAQCRESGAALLFVTHDRRLAPRFDRQISLREINGAFH